YETLAHATLQPPVPDAFQKAVDAAKTALPPLRARVPTLRVQTNPPPASLSDLVVTVNGTKLDNDLVGIARPLDPGMYKIAVTAAGYKTAKLEIEIKEGDTKTADLQLGRR